jgi:hypothetical protein
LIARASGQGIADRLEVPADELLRRAGLQRNQCDDLTDRVVCSLLCAAVVETVANRSVGACKVPLLLGHYETFFAASAGASAAILGLLVVAVSVVNADDEDAKTRERRTVLAGSAFLALVDAFFVSIVSLTGGAAGLRDIQPRDGDGRLAGHLPLDRSSKAGRELLPRLSNP